MKFHFSLELKQTKSPAYIADVSRALLYVGTTYNVWKHFIVLGKNIVKAHEILSKAGML